jgi:hypothetical protein
LDFAAITDTGRALQLFKWLINLGEAEFDLDQFLEEVDNRLALLSTTHKKITEASKVESVTAMLQLAGLAEEARKEIGHHREWFQTSQKGIGHYVAAWGRFYDGIAALMPKVVVPTNSPVKSKAKAPDAPVVQAAPVSSEVLKLREQLETAKANEGHLRTDLEETRRELHEWRQKAEALRVFKPRDGHIVCDTSLIRRVSLREALRADEVLAYIEFIAGDRVVILPSAWDTAEKYPAAFGAADRMLDLLDKLVFPYLDSINSGNPDAVARMHLGGDKAYSAQESATTLASARLRAMREFRYEGELHVFKRHLRVSNLTGLEGMRVFFEIIDQRVVIAYAGPHLEVSSSS